MGLVEHLIAASAHNHGQQNHYPEQAERQEETVNGPDGNGNGDAGEAEHQGQAEGDTEMDFQAASGSPSHNNEEPAVVLPLDDATRIKNLEETVQMLRDRLSSTEEKVGYLRQELDTLYGKRTDAQQQDNTGDLSFMSGFKEYDGSNLVNGGSASGFADAANRRKRSSSEDERKAGGAGNGSLKKKKPRTATERKVVSVRKAFADWLCERFGIPRTSQSKEFPLFPGEDNLPKDTAGQPFMRIDWVQDGASPTSEQTQALIAQAVSDFTANPIAHRLETDDLQDTDEVKRHCLHRYQLIRDNAITRQNGGTIPSRPSRVSLGGATAASATGAAGAPSASEEAAAQLPDADQSLDDSRQDPDSSAMAGPPGQPQSHEPAPPPPFDINVNHVQQSSAAGDSGVTAEADVKHDSNFEAGHTLGSSFVGVGS